MFIDARMELTPPVLLDAGTHISRVIDLNVTGGSGRFDLDAVLIVRAARGPVGAAFQVSDDGSEWADLFRSNDLPPGSTSVRDTAFDKRFVRVVWRVADSATVAARINNQGEI